MIKVFLEPINSLIKFDKNIKKCNIESPELYRNIALNTKKVLTISINDNLFNFDKKVLILYNPFEININDSKNIKFLYKKIELSIEKNHLKKIYDLENKIYDLMEEITNDFDLPLNYKSNIEIQKIFSAVGLEYDEPITYIEKLVYYFKLLKEIDDYCLIVSFGLLNLLKQEEVLLLEKELKINELYLIDFNLSQNNVNIDIIIDQDWCII